VLPEEHLTGLRKSVEDHEQRIAELREVIIPAIEEEIALHEALRDLAQNEDLIALVGEVHDDPSLASSLARAPQEYLEKKDVPLPANVTLSAVDADESVARLTVNLSVGSTNVEVIWDREAGFFARPLSPVGLPLPRSYIETRTNGSPRATDVDS
jgi:hypothetical protein